MNRISLNDKEEALGLVLKRVEAATWNLTGDAELVGDWLARRPAVMSNAYVVFTDPAENHIFIIFDVPHGTHCHTGPHTTACLECQRFTADHYAREARRAQEED